MSEHDEPQGIARLDRWLFAARLFKSRSAAAEAVAGGKVHLNGARVKPAHEVRVGDAITFSRQTVEFECAVTGLPLRRGPASEAALCYEETAESKARRQEFVTRMKVAGQFAIRPAGRPDKHARQRLRQLRGRD